MYPACVPHDVAVVCPTEAGGCLQTQSISAVRLVACAAFCGIPVAGNTVITCRAGQTSRAEVLLLAECRIAASRGMRHSRCMRLTRSLAIWLVLCGLSVVDAFETATSSLHAF